MSKVLLTKDEFINYMNEYKKIYDSSEKLNEALRTYDNCTDFSGFSNFRALSLIEDLLVRLMNDEVNDSDGYSMISYFIYELEFGSKYREGMITEADGTPINLSSVESLYDYLANQTD